MTFSMPGGLHQQQFGRFSTKAIPAREAITLASGLGGIVWIEHADIAAA